jgi:hypothetical protein
LDNFFSFLGASRTILRLVADDADVTTPNAFELGATNAEALKGEHAMTMVANWNFMFET